MFGAGKRLVASIIGVVTGIWMVSGTHAWAAIPSKVAMPDFSRLSDVRKGILDLEKQLFLGLRVKGQTQARVKRLERLIALRKTERELTAKRLSELERFVGELETRRKILDHRIKLDRQKMRGFLKEIDRSFREAPAEFPSIRRERTDAPKRTLMARLVERGVQNVEAYHADMMDADQLEQQIEEEKSRLVYLSQDMKEQESLLEFHRRLQEEELKVHEEARLAQLESYRALKESEAQVEALISQFNARREMERIQETKKSVTRAMRLGDFVLEKGKLPLPVNGQIVGKFGRGFDPRSKLQVFRKGIDILTQVREEVRAVFSGRVVFAGSLPGYGNVTILDHGTQYYTLCANLDKISVKDGDFLAKGEQVGMSSGTGMPVYFEVRSRNVPVNPLQWVQQ